MKILIILKNTIPLVIHETLSLAFALASFGHEIQLHLADGVANELLAKPDEPLSKMLASLDLYDIPPAWLSAECYQRFLPALPDTLSSQLMPQACEPSDMGKFDTTLSF